MPIFKIVSSEGQKKLCTGNSIAEKTTNAKLKLNLKDDIDYKVNEKKK